MTFEMKLWELVVIALGSFHAGVIFIIWWAYGRGPRD